MIIQLTNTLGGRKEVFQPLAACKARIYSCGPTVKEPLNLAKFRSYVFADLLRRHLEYAGYEVLQVMNITDVGHLNEFEEDLVEIAAARTGINAWELVEKEERSFHEDRRALHVLDAHRYPRAHEHIEEMIALIAELEKKGLTYKAGGNLYFDITKDREFGKLTGKSAKELEKLLATSRTPAHPEKHHRLDIDLWRTDALHQAHWPSPWGRGFPGWHVECVAMSRKYLGETFDIHTGSWENIFPHHECEIAQAESLSGKPLARIWLHTGPVNVDGKPMTPQNQNVVTARELIEAGIRGIVLRIALLSAPYRDVLDFGEPLLDRARGQVNSVLAFHEYLSGAANPPPANEAPSESPAAWITETEADFRAAMDDDLDYPRALALIVDRIDKLEPETIGDAKQALEAITRWDRVLGILS